MKHKQPYQQETDVLELHEDFINARANKNRRANKYERKMADKQKSRRKAWN
jgi:hypothetical protein